METIKRGWLTEDQIQMLIDAEEANHYKLMWAIMADCGLRISEAISLTVGAVRFNGDPAPQLKITGKGGKVRYIKMTKRVRRLVMDVTTGGDRGAALFPVGARAAQKQFKRTAGRIGLQGHITPHSLRHSYATRSLKGGADIDTVRQTMGHSQINTTQVYLHVSDGYLDAAVGAIERVTSDAAARRSQTTIIK